jgi:hypothetical protein
LAYTWYVLALPIRQPLSELILQGIKTAEPRATPTLREGLEAVEAALRVGYIGHTGTHSSNATNGELK